MTLLCRQSHPSWGLVLLLRVVHLLAKQTLTVLGLLILLRNGAATTTPSTEKIAYTAAF
jgi:hypothetical protein